MFRLLKHYLNPLIAQFKHAWNTILESVGNMVLMSTMTRFDKPTNMPACLESETLSVIFWVRHAILNWNQLANMALWSLWNAMAFESVRKYGFKGIMKCCGILIGMSVSQRKWNYVRFFFNSAMLYYFWASRQIWPWWGLWHGMAH